MDGYIKLYRKLLEWEWYTDSKTLHLFLHCLLKANHKDKKWRGIDIKRGQFVTSYETLSNETKITLQEVRTRIKWLISTYELTKQSTSQYTILTVNNYDHYQQDNIRTNKQLTNKQQTTNKQLTTTNNDNNDNNEKNIIYMSYKKKINFNSKLTEKARTKINKRLKTFKEQDLLKAIDNFSKDKWWMEKNSHRGVAWFFHSDDRIDQFINLKSKKNFENENDNFYF